MPITIRAARLNDLACIVALDKQSPALAHWSEAEYARVIAGPSHVVLLAESLEQAALGFLVGRKTGNQWDLENVVVVEGQHRRGIGWSLIATFLEQARKEGAEMIYLEVRSSNAAAIGLYRRAGFRQDGIRRAYYSHPSEDALLFSLSLENSS